VKATTMNIESNYTIWYQLKIWTERWRWACECPEGILGQL